MGFFTFTQNNSGGNFVFDKNAGITHHVIVEGNTREHAIDRAEDIGLYFDGYGDCPCCGYRWSTPWEDEASECPEIYGQSIEDYFKPDDTGRRSAILWMKPNPEVVIHYLDKPFEWVDVQNKEEKQENRRKSRKPQMPE